MIDTVNHRPFPLAAVAAELRSLLGKDRVLSSLSEVTAYECDGFVIEKNSPDVVVFPEATSEVVEIIKICRRHDVVFLPRGAGTRLA